MSHTPNYIDGTGGISSVGNTERTPERLCEDDHLQSHRNWIKSKRSVFERSLTISKGDDFTESSPENFLANVPRKLVCNGNLNTFFSGPTGQKPLWNPATNLVENLVESAYYLLTVDWGMASFFNFETTMKLIDTFDGITVIAFTTPAEGTGVGFSSFFQYQSTMVFLTPPTNVTGRTYEIEVEANEQNMDMSERQVTIHRER